MRLELGSECDGDGDGFGDSTHPVPSCYPSQCLCGTLARDQFSQQTVGMLTFSSHQQPPSAADFPTLEGAKGGGTS